MFLDPGRSFASIEAFLVCSWLSSSVREGRRLNFPSSATKSYRRIFVQAGNRILAYGIRHKAHVLKVSTNMKIDDS